VDGRGGSLADRASLALTPVAGIIPPAPAARSTPAAPSRGDQDKLQREARFLAEQLRTVTDRRDELAVRLRNLESIDIPHHRAACEASVKKLLGIDPLNQNQKIELNSSLTTLPALDAKARLLPALIKAVKADLGKAEETLAELTKVK
jgi:hypothetical protein